MSAPAVVAAEPTSAQPTLRSVLRANRGLLVIVALLLAGAVLVVLAQGRQTRGLLDPDAVDPSGAGAVAALLAGQGVTVVRVTDTAAAQEAVVRAGVDSTLVVAPTATLSSAMVQATAQMRTHYRVLLAPDPDVLTTLVPEVDETGVHQGGTVSEPGCAWDVAARAGSVSTDGTTYRTVRADGHDCYDGSLIDLPTSAASHAVTVVGNPTAMTNDRLGDLGNASMSLGVLGRAPTVVWWLPSPNDPLQRTAGGDVSVSDLVPSWVGWAVLQVFLGVLVVAYWRGRRLGRVVVEPLPVVVRPSEAVEGRGRLYRRGRARGHAADTLRLASIRRLRPLLSLPRAADVDTVVAAVASRTGRTETDVRTLLVPGTDPTDDAGLTRLATALDTLENEVRRS